MRRRWPDARSMLGGRYVRARWPRGGRAAVSHYRCSRGGAREMAERWFGAPWRPREGRWSGGGKPTAGLHCRWCRGMRKGDGLTLGGWSTVAAWGWGELEEGSTSQAQAAMARRLGIWGIEPVTPGRIKHGIDGSLPPFGLWIARRWRRRRFTHEAEEAMSWEEETVRGIVVSFSTKTWGHGVAAPSWARQWLFCMWDSQRLEFHLFNAWLLLYQYLFF
jgi:hypothetical protein